MYLEFAKVAFIPILQINRIRLKRTWDLLKVIENGRIGA